MIETVYYSVMQRLEMEKLKRENFALRVEVGVLKNELSLSRELELRCYGAVIERNAAILAEAEAKAATLRLKMRLHFVAQWGELINAQQRPCRRKPVSCYPPNCS